MAHEITATDGIVTARGIKPWHGLGKTLDGILSPAQAIEAEVIVPAPGNRLFGLALDDDGYVLTAESLIDAMTSPDFAVST